MLRRPKITQTRSFRLPEKPLVGLVLVACTLVFWGSRQLRAESFDPRPPRVPVKLVFVHHSCGENWLADSNGGLGRALAANNYFVSDTNYGWGPNGIGDRTDITDWPEWFAGHRSNTYLRALFRESGQHSSYTRTMGDPGGENQIVMFKSCYPNSNLSGRPTDPPRRGHGLTVGNAKAIYIDLLRCFASRPDKLFVVITAPPVQDRTHAANARAFNTWLVRDWLADCRGKNVAVFDFHNVLTSPTNHHRVRSGRVEYTTRSGAGTLYYPTGDDHPSRTANRKATDEFVPLLNAYYNRWIASAPKPNMARTATRTSGARFERAGHVASAPRNDLARRVVRGSPDPAPLAPRVPVNEIPSVVSRSASQPEVREPTATIEPTWATKPTTTTARGTIDGFEGDVDAWSAFAGDTDETRLSFDQDLQVKHGGAASLRIRYEVAPGGWANCSLVYDRHRDWGDFQGLSLYLHAERVGQRVTIVAYGGTPDGLLFYQHELQADQAAVSGWKPVRVTWQEMKPPPWQGGPSEFDPRAASGVAIAFEPSENGDNTGQLWIDDVTLISGRPSGDAPAVTTPNRDVRAEILSSSEVRTETIAEATTVLPNGVRASIYGQEKDPRHYDIGQPTLTDIWVDPTSGENTNSGATRDQALETIGAAWNRIPMGETLTGTGYRIMLVAGTYPESSLPPANYWEKRYGTYQFPIVIRSADGVGTAILPSMNVYDCRYLYLIGLQLTSAHDNILHLDGCDHVLVRQAQLLGQGESAAWTCPAEVLKANQTEYLYVEDSEISNGSNGAVACVAVRHGHIVGNRIHGAEEWCIYLKGGSAYLRVENNEIFDGGTGGVLAGQGAGFQFMVSPWIHYEAYDIKFLNNVIHHTKGAGMGVNGGYNILMAHNTVYHVGERSHIVE